MSNNKFSLFTTTALPEQKKIIRINKKKFVDQESIKSALGGKKFIVGRIC